MAQRLETLLRQSTSSLLGATVHKYAPNVTLVASAAATQTTCDSKTILKYFQSAHPPVCPTCLNEDAQPYERLAWSLRAAPACLKHLCCLANTCPKCHRKLRPGRSDVAVCRCGFNFRDLQPIEVSDSAARLLRKITKGFGGEASPLSSLPTCAGLWWLERLVAAVKKLPDWVQQTIDAQSLEPSAPADLAPWLAAADLLDAWPQKLFRFLDEFQRVAKHRTTATGSTISFWSLVREAKRLEALGYSSPADALREYLTGHYTAGHLTRKACLFSTPQHAKLLQHRPWMSLTEADETLHFRKGGSAALLERGILTGAVRSAKSGHRTVGVVSRDSVDEVARELETAVSVCEAGQSLGLGRSRVLELIKADMLPRAIWTKGGWRNSTLLSQPTSRLDRRMPRQRSTKHLLAQRWAGDAAIRADGSQLRSAPATPCGAAGPHAAQKGMRQLSGPAGIGVRFKSAHAPTFNACAMKNKGFH